MPARASRAALAVVVVGLLALATPATAAPPAQVWVSGTGDDINTNTGCTRDAPCRTLAQALTVSNSGGEIVSVDGGDFGPVTITTPLTIDLTEGPGLIANNGSGTAIVVAAGPTDDVVLRGVGIAGPAGACPYGGGTGIDVQSAGSVTIEGGQIGQQKTAVEVDPTAGAPAVTLDKVAIDGACTGVDIAPGPAASSKVMVRKSTIARSGVGVFASGTSHTWVNGVTFTNNTTDTQTLGGAAVIDRLGYGPVGATGAQGPQGQAGANGSPGAQGPAGPPAFKLVVALARTSLRGVAGRAVKVSFRSTAAATATLAVTRRGKVVARVSDDARAGRNTLSWSGRGARAGSYRLRLTAVGGDGQTVVKTASLRLRERLR